MSRVVAAARARASCSPRLRAGRARRTRSPQRRPRATWPPGRSSPLGETLHLDSRLALVDNMLLYFDKMSMATSLEVRVPFMDHDVVAFCARLPDSRRVWQAAPQGAAQAREPRPGRGRDHRQAEARLLPLGARRLARGAPRRAGARRRCWMAVRWRAASSGPRPCAILVVRGRRGRQEGKPAALLPAAPRALAADLRRRRDSVARACHRLARRSGPQRRRRHPPGRRARAA